MSVSEFTKLAVEYSELLEEIHSEHYASLSVNKTDLLSIFFLFR